MADEDSEWVPSEEELEGFDEEAYLRGATTAEDDDDDDDEPALFDDAAGPLALLEGMEAEGRVGREAFEVLAASRRRRSRRLRTSGPGTSEEEEKDDEGEEGGADEEEEEQVPEPPPQRRGRGRPPNHGRGRGRGRPPLASPRGGGAQRGGASSRAQQERATQLFGASVDEIWNEDLAEQMGLAPARSRRKQRNRDRWRRRAAKQGRKRRDGMTEEVRSKLGEANLLYANQRHQEAITLLMEVIRLAPNLPDPYHTLGLLHEAVGNGKKALDFYMIAAHLTPTDIALWRRLAGLSAEHGLVRQAIYCYTRVLRREKDDVDAKFDRALLYAEIEDFKKAIESFEQIQVVRPGHSEVPKALARLYHRIGAPDKAMEVLHNHIHSHPSQTDLTHINILAELYTEAREWRRCLALIERCERDFCGDEALPVDLQVKAGSALAHLGRAAEAVAAYVCVLDEPLDACADLYLEAGNALLANGQPAHALPFFRALAERPDLSGPEVWSQLVACHRAAGDRERALDVYRTLLQGLGEGDPRYVDLSVLLAELHRELGQQEEAERVIDELESRMGVHDALPVDHAAAIQAVLRRASILQACGKTEAFLELAMPVLGATLRALQLEHQHQQSATAEDKALQRRLKYLGRMSRRRETGEEGGIFVGYQATDRRRPHVRELDQRAQQLLDSQRLASQQPFYGATGAGSDTEGEDVAPLGPAAGLVLRELERENAPFIFLMQTVEALLSSGRPAEARELVQASLDVCGRRWKAARWKKPTLQLLLAQAALAAGDFSAASQALRPAANAWPHSTAVWNAYCRYLVETGGVKQALKFLTPLRARNPTSLPLMLVLGHCHLLAGSHAAALGEYFHAYRVAPEEPLVLLCIGVGLLAQSATKRVPDRHRAVLQAFAFLQEYSEARRHPQEAAYNLGRACHQLGLVHLAVPYYQAVLAHQPTVDEEEHGGSAGGDAAATAEAMAALDLRREAAHNLALIYKGSGAHELAREVLRKHLTV